MKTCDLQPKTKVMIRSFIIHLHYLSLLSGASNTTMRWDEQEVEYKVHGQNTGMLAEDSQVEKRVGRYVSIYSTGDSSMVVAKNQKWFYPAKIPTESHSG